MRSLEMYLIRALVWKLSVTMPIWAPVKLIAVTPRLSMAMAISATLTCSPVDSSMSISRAGGRSVISRASAINSSVVCPRAETTTSTCSPRRCAWIARRAAARILFESATLVPPNFCTSKDNVLNSRSAFYRTLGRKVILTAEDSAGEAASRLRRSAISKQPALRFLRSPLFPSGTPWRNHDANSRRDVRVSFRGRPDSSHCVCGGRDASAVAHLAGRWLAVPPG